MTKSKLNGKLLTPKDVEKIYGFAKVGTLANMRNQGRGPKYIKIGKIFYREEDVERWINTHYIRTSESA